MTRRFASGRGWAYTGAALGGVASVAANVAHSYVPPTGSPAGWTPEPGAVIGAAFWPLALLVAVEILARVQWPDGRWWLSLRIVGVGLVAVVAAVVSYLHLSGLLDHYGDSPVTVLLGPLAVDGLMLTATAALVATSRQPATVVQPVLSVPDVTIAAEVEPPAPAVVPVAAPREPRQRRQPAEAGDLLLVAQAVAAELHAAGTPLTRRTLVTGLRARGRSCGTDRANQLLRELAAA